MQLCTHGEKVNRDSCLPECSAGEYTALARARLCRAVYFTAALYTGTHSSLCTFFPFVHRACIYSTYAKAKLLLIQMATKAVIGRGLREAGAALKHASGMEVCLVVSD